MSTMTTRVNALAEIDNERENQLARWGQQQHSAAHWLAIAGEEFGEVAQRVCRADIPPIGDIDRRRELRELRHELVQLAAVCVAWLEHLDDDGISAR